MPLSTNKVQQSMQEKSNSQDGLISLARLGDSRAFETLFTHYHEQIKLYLIHMVGNDAIGHELTQETFLKAWQGLPSLHEEARFVGWLYRIATNIARDYQRRSQLVRWLPWERYQNQHESDELVQDGPERQIEETELLRMALVQVSLKYRVCIILYVVEELPQAQVAEYLGIKASYVSNYVRRGLDQLREAYTHLVDEQGSSRKKNEI